MKNMIIGLGNTGTNIVKMAATSSRLNEVTFYTIDSVVDDIDLDSLNKAINDLSTIIAPLAKLFRK